MPRFKSSTLRGFFRTRTLFFLCLLVAAFACLGSPGDVKAQAPGEIVLSQIYTGGGNPGSTYKDNFLELFNRSNTPIDVSGWRFYIGSDTGPLNTAVSFSSSRGLTIQPGGYLLIQFETTGSSGGSLPFPDLFVPQFGQFSINLPASGKIALTTRDTTLFGQCPIATAGIIDFVGYGSTANCFEGSGPTATLSNTTVAIRKASGCTDSNNNNSDFSVATPTPRNSFSPKHVCSANPIDDAEFFVRQHYADFLNRQPDAAGLAYWTNQITSCGADQSCIEIRRVNVSAAFFLSIEFQETGYLVHRLYKAAYGDVAGTSTLDGTTHQLSVPSLRFQEFLADSQQISQGLVVGQPGWQQVLENNKQSFIASFVQRDRFTTAYPPNMTAAQFVDALNVNAGGALSASERNQLVGELESGAKTRAQVLRAVAEDADLHNAEVNRAFVLMQYFGYLRRNPNDAPDSDHTGYEFWLNKLNQFNGNFVNAQMVTAFITSIEYRQRF